MAKTMIRPKITVESVCLGTQTAEEVFVSLLVSEVKKQCSVRTFELMEQPQYNRDIQLKEVS